jgi:hypothetical protein
MAQLTGRSAKSQGLLPTLLNNQRKESDKNKDLETSRCSFVVLCLVANQTGIDLQAFDKKWI